MASSYKYPEKYIAWFIKGNHIAIVTTKGETDGTTHSQLGQYKPIDEAVTNGVLLHYQGEPNAVSAITDTPDIDNVFHSSLIDYVKSKLYQDKAGITSDPNIASVSLNLSQVHEAKWVEATKKHGANKRDKTGGSRMIRLPDLT
tara:strand:- start:539 stop:970 length:432 start_codon:yes stop_codon:yes gene_type:complete